MRKQIKRNRSRGVLYLRQQTNVKFPYQVRNKENEESKRGIEVSVKMIREDSNEVEVGEPDEGRDRQRGR